MVENTYLINRPKPGIIAKRVPDRKGRRQTANVKRQKDKRHPGYRDAFKYLYFLVNRSTG